MYFKIALLIALAAAAAAQPVDKIAKGVNLTKTKPGLKHKLEDNSEDLLNPIDNLVEPDPAPKNSPVLSDSLLPPPSPTAAPEKAAEEKKEDDSENVFPDRQGFITGHRIPIELFSEETQKRVQADANSKYVDASNFRSKVSKEEDEDDEKTTADKHEALVVEIIPEDEDEEEEAVEAPDTLMMPPSQEPVYPGASSRILHAPRSDSFAPFGEEDPSDPLELSLSPFADYNPEERAFGPGFSGPTVLVDAGLSHEKDPAYFGHLHAFVPLDY